MSSLPAPTPRHGHPSPNGSKIEISLKDGLVTLRNPSDPSAASLRFTPYQWHTFLEQVRVPIGDHLSDEDSRLGKISCRRPRGTSVCKRSKKRARGGAEDAAVPPNKTGGFNNIYEFLKWVIEYVAGNGRENRRFRTVILMGWGLACVTILVTGVAVAIAHTGMPIIIAYSIGAGGTALFTLATALISRLRRPKK
jgi:hypothetical protein